MNFFSNFCEIFTKGLTSLLGSPYYHRRFTVVLVLSLTTLDLTNKASMLFVGWEPSPYGECSLIV